MPLRSKVSGPEDRETLGAMLDRAASYAAAGRRAEAIKVQEDDLRIFRKEGDLKYSDSLLHLASLAGSHFAAGRRDEAIQWQEEALQIVRKEQGAEHATALDTMITLAEFYREAAGRTRPPNWGKPAWRFPGESLVPPTAAR